ncbi:hypothetical protein BC829DRAFT_398984 [Chytridium lagenaria]|nr:hypothetical protein BC829DRAFT_398984 [Chytridium lagenaria]
MQTIRRLRVSAQPPLLQPWRPLMLMEVRWNHDDSSVKSGLSLEDCAKLLGKIQELKAQLKPTVDAFYARGPVNESIEFKDNVRSQSDTNESKKLKLTEKLESIERAETELIRILGKEKVADGTWDRYKTAAEKLEEGMKASEDGSKKTGEK